MLGTKMSDACLGRVTGIVCYDSDIVFNETGFALRFSLKSRRCSHSKTARVLEWKQHRNGWGGGRLSITFKTKIIIMFYAGRPSPSQAGKLGLVDGLAAETVPLRLELLVVGTGEAGFMVVVRPRAVRAVMIDVESA